MSPADLHEPAAYWIQLSLKRFNAETTGLPAHPLEAFHVDRYAAGRSAEALQIPPDRPSRRLPPSLRTFAWCFPCEGCGRFADAARLDPRRQAQQAVDIHVPFEMLPKSIERLINRAVVIRAIGTAAKLGQIGGAERIGCE